MKKWTKDKLFEEALWYTSRFQFQQESKYAYNRLIQLELLNEACQHMKPLRHTWTFDRVQEEAGKYSARTLFKKGSTCAYRAAIREGWIDEVCKHMEPTGNLFKRCVYELRSGKKVYTGITYNLKQRLIGHRTKQTLGPQGFEVVQLTDYIEAKDALRIEKQLIILNRASKSLESINIKDGGQLGGGVNNAL